MGRLRREVAHLFGWHTLACLGDPRCYRPGAAKVNAIGWHRYLSDRGPS